MPENVVSFDTTSRKPDLGLIGFGKGWTPGTFAPNPEGGRLSPDEWIARAALGECDAFVRRLAHMLSA